MKYLITVAIALFLLLPAQAQVEQYRFVAGSAFGGGYASGPERFVTINAEPFVSYAFGQNWIFGLNGSINTRSMANEQYSIYHTGVFTTRYLGRRSFQPLIGVQAGYVWADISEGFQLSNKPVEGFMVGLHGGIAWWVNDRVGLYLQAHQRWMMKGSVQPSRLPGIGIGVAVQLGSGQQPALFRPKPKEELPKW